MPARPWLVITLCLIATAVLLSLSRTRDYMHERRVIDKGTSVDATVVSIGLSAAREGSRDEVQGVSLRYTPPGVTDAIEATGELQRRPGSMISLKDVLRIKIDPAQPTYWTERTDLPPIWQSLVMPMFCLAIALLSGFVAWMRRASILQVVRDGDRVAGTIVSVRQSPLAPLSKQVGVVVNGNDRRVLHCYWPNRIGGVRVGQSVDLIVLTPKVLIASLYRP